MFQRFQYLATDVCNVALREQVYFDRFVQRTSFQKFGHNPHLFLHLERTLELYNIGMVTRRQEPNLTQIVSLLLVAQVGQLLDRNPFLGFRIFTAKYTTKPAFLLTIFGNIEETYPLLLNSRLRKSFLGSFSLTGERTVPIL